MKKILYFASMMLAIGMTYSCSIEKDNPVGPQTYTIEDENGNKYETDLIATLQGEVGSEVDLTLGVYDAFDIYGVDFGDGKIVVDTVCFQNGGLKDENGLSREDTEHKSATKFTGTVAGNGIIKIYGKSDLWYLITTNGAIPTSFDQEKLKKVVQVTIAGVNTDKVELPQLDSLKVFNFNNSPVRKVDVSKAPNLTSLRIQNMKSSLYDNLLEGVDVSNNPKLDYLYLGVSSADKEGNISSVDLSNNTVIKNVYISGVHLKSITLPAQANITTLNLSDNELSAIDLSKGGIIKSLNVSGNQFTSLSLAGLDAASVSTLTVNNNQLTTVDFAGALAEKVALDVSFNQLTELDVPVVTNNLSAQSNKLKKFSYQGLSSGTRYLRLQDNELTFATLPLKPEKQTNARYYVYYPQADMEVAPEGAVLDLSAQASAQGVLDAAVATTFTVKAGEATLAAGEDYTIDNGKITFLKSATGVVVEMTTEAFPQLTLKTKAFDVTAGGAAEGVIWKAAPAEEVPAGTTIVDNDFATIKTVFTAKADASATTVCGVAFDAALLVRSKAAISADNLNGTENGNSSTPLIYTAKKNATIKIYYRRQTGDGFVAGDGKDIKCIDQANPSEKSALAGTITFDETLTDVTASYGLVMKTYQVEAGHVYTIYGRGTTISCYGIAFE